MMPPKLVSDMSEAELEEYQHLLEYMKPMWMNLEQDEKGLWGVCGRCGARMVQLVGVGPEKSVTYVMDVAKWPQWCGKCGQRVRRSVDEA